jgi:hypothetical protein
MPAGTTLLNNQATDRLIDSLLKLDGRLALVLARKSITMRTMPRALKGSGAVRMARPVSIPNRPRPTFQIFMMRNASRGGYRGAPGVKE